MKTPVVPPSRRVQAFTLVELLVVISIIALLAGIAFPSFSAILKKMKREQARTLAQQIVNSIKGYYTEYSKYPLPADFSGGEVTPMLTDEILTSALMGRDPQMNPKKIPFLPDLKTVEEGGGNGLKTTGEQVVIVDPWGVEFNVIMDADYSNDVDNPNAASGATKVYQGVLVWSSGEDKDPSTWDDNIMSWDSGKKNNPNQPQSK